MIGGAQYFFALAPVPNPNNPNSTVLTRAEIVAFQSDCPEVASSIVYLHTGIYNPNSTENGKEVSILKQVGSPRVTTFRKLIEVQFAFWRFDAQGAVINYDAFIPNLSPWSAIASGQLTSNPAFRAASIEQLCGLIENRCVGNNTQYQTARDCIEVLSNKPYGEFSEAWGDNFVCRVIHAILTQIRPEVCSILRSQLVQVAKGC